MRSALALCCLVAAAGLGACGPSDKGKAHSIARLERLVLQARAAEQTLLMAPREPFTTDPEKTVARLKAHRDLEKLRAEIDQFSTLSPAEIDMREKRLHEISDVLDDEISERLK